MIAVACGMEDDGANNIDKNYASHQLRSELEGMVAISEFEYINRVVVRNPPIKFTRQ